MTDASYKARVDILAAMLPQAAFDGWTQKALRAAVKNTDLPKGAEELYFPEGPLEVIRFWSEQMNLSLIHISEPTRLRRSRMPSSA